MFVNDSYTKDHYDESDDDDFNFMYPFANGNLLHNVDYL
jgi:hypothetical protein